MQQFRFREAPAEPPVERLSLWVQFDGVALAREVRAAGLPYWGSERPDLLFGWRSMTVVDATWCPKPVEPRRNRCVAAGKRHGLPLTLPLIDLEDQRAIQFTDVWGGFTGTIATASRRYRPQVVLTGRLERSSLPVNGGLTGNCMGGANSSLEGTR